MASNHDEVDAHGSTGHPGEALVCLHGDAPALASVRCHDGQVEVGVGLEVPSGTRTEEIHAGLVAEVLPDKTAYRGDRVRGKAHYKFSAVCCVLP